MQSQPRSRTGSTRLTRAQRNERIVPLGKAQTHIEAEHINGTLAVAPVLAAALADA